MPETLLAPLLALPIILLPVALYWVDRVRRREALFRWAAGSGVRILSFRQPLPTEASPFPLAASKAQHVFRVEVEDRDGGRRSGWVRVGGPWRGLVSRRADVRWVAA